MLDLINKAAITVIHKEPFIKWVQSSDAETDQSRFFCNYPATRWNN